jgi:hypothetical protein
MNISACWNNISFFVGNVNFMKNGIMLRHSAIFASIFALYKDFSHFLSLPTKNIYKDRSCLVNVSVECKRRSPRCDFTHWYVYIYIYLIFILQFLLLYTHSCDCGDISRWCCRMMTRVSTNGEQAAEPVKKSVFKFRMLRYRRVFF